MCNIFLLYTQIPNNNALFYSEGTHPYFKAMHSLV